MFLMLGNNHLHKFLVKASFEITHLLVQVHCHLHLGILAEPGQLGLNRTHMPAAESVCLSLVKTQAHWFGTRSLAFL